MGDAQDRHVEHRVTVPGPPRLVRPLTGVRALMGLWVVADHLYLPMVALLPAVAVLRPMLSGGIALDTFFILSGFVISHVYAERLARGGRSELRAFFWARLSRLYPTHLFALLVMALLVLVGLDAQFVPEFPREHSAPTFLGNVFLLQALPAVDAWNPPAWSVSTEFGAYLLFPLAAAALLRPSRRIAYVLAAAVMLTTIVVVTALAGTSLLAVAVLWVRPIGEIAFGCLLWAEWRRGGRPHRLWDLVAVGALAGVLLVVFTWPGGPRRSLALFFLGLFVVAVASSAGVVHRALSCRFMDWAGRTSYSRYLMHIPVLVVLSAWTPLSLVAGAHWSWRVALLVSWFAATFVVGGLTHRFVEEPARRWLRDRGPGRPREDTSGSPSCQPGSGSALVTAGSRVTVAQSRNAAR